MFLHNPSVVLTVTFTVADFVDLEVTAPVVVPAAFVAAAAVVAPADVVVAVVAAVDEWIVVVVDGSVVVRGQDADLS